MRSRGTAAPLARALRVLGVTAVVPLAVEAQLCTTARAEDGGPVESADYFSRRYEPAGFPKIGGNSDVGFELGGVATLSYFANGTRPYAWNMDVAAWLSVKGGPTGTELAQQSLQWNWDRPGLFGGGIRLNPQVAYTRTINQGYFGLGNDSSGALPQPSNPDPGRFHQFIQRVVQANSSARIDVDGPWKLMSAVGYRYVAPEAYAASKLAADASAPPRDDSPRIFGTGPLSLASLAGGFVYDSRDDEIFTRSGMYGYVGERRTPMPARAHRANEYFATTAAFTDSARIAPFG